MGVVLIAAVFQALGQAADSAPAARHQAVDAALRSCVEQAATVALGRDLDEAEGQVLQEQLLPEARTFVDRFRIVDEGTGGGTHFAYVEADVALGRLLRRLAPEAPSVKTALARERGATMEVRGTGDYAAAVRVHGDVWVADKHVGVVDETAWGFGPSETAAQESAERRADRAARVAAHAMASSSDVAVTSLWVSVRGLTRPNQALHLREALTSRVPGVRAVHLLRAGAGRADWRLETEREAREVADSLEELDLDGFSLTAEVTPGGGEVQAQVLPP